MPSNPKLTLALSCTDRQVEFVQYFQESAQKLGVDLKLIALAIEPAFAPVQAFADKVLKQPLWIDPNFIDQVIAICQQEGVDLLVPTNDVEILSLAQNKAKFESIGTYVLVSDPEAIEVANNKLKTFAFALENDIPTVKTLSVSDYLKLKEPWPLPLMAKPNDGQGSADLLRIHHDYQVPLIKHLNENTIIQPLLKGYEFTIDMLFDRSSQLLSYVPYYRYDYIQGEVWKEVTYKHKSIQSLINNIKDCPLKFRGPICFQAFLNKNGEAHLTEINARIGLGYPMAHNAGCPFTEWILAEHLGIPFKAHSNYKEELKLLRYHQAVFM